MMRRLNRFVERNMEFIRRFMNGATQVELDGSGRLLLPKPLATHAGIGKEVKLVGMMDRIRWSKERHADTMREDVDLTARPRRSWAAWAMLMASEYHAPFFT